MIDVPHAVRAMLGRLGLAQDMIGGPIPKFNLGCQDRLNPMDLVSSPSNHQGRASFSPTVSLLIHK
jgi:hypothetical protein